MPPLHRLTRDHDPRAADPVIYQLLDPVPDPARGDAEAGRWRRATTSKHCRRCSRSMRAG